MSDKKMKRIFIVQMFLLVCVVCNATHNRAGQILYRHISGYTYEFTLITFTSDYTITPADRQYLTFDWGDNTTSDVFREPRMRQDVLRLPGGYQKNVYTGQHTFPGPGVYTIFAQDPNRNAGVENIPNSVSVMFCVKTVFMIDPNIGHNSTPELLNYPIDRAAVGQRFVHNPSAFDIDGDSLSYELSRCLRERGVEIEGFIFPESSNQPVYVDEITGDLVWDAPVKAGLYNVAMKINEWRFGYKISSIVRDMQIEVVDSKNRPPVFPILKDTCVIAGEKISFTFDVTDPDNDLIELTATGGPFQVLRSPAEPLLIVNKEPGKTTATFTWQTHLSHVRNQRYTVIFKAEDQNDEVKLVSFANFNITVIAPEVENLQADAIKNEIRLEWNPSECEHASGYEIYRRIGCYDNELKQCDTGVPTEWGYERIGTQNGIANTFYTDNNNNRGLSPGILYCYRVVAIFPDGAKSKPSERDSASLLPGMPPMIRAHVETVETSGEIHVVWLGKPVQKAIAEYEENTGKNDVNFEYRLFHSLSRNSDWTQLQLDNPQNISDTTYIHLPIDTKNQYPHYYKVELWDMDNNLLVDDNPETASTLYPILEPSDKSVIINFGRHTPWINTNYEIYRCTKTGTDDCIPDLNSDLVGLTNRETYTDTGLKNGQEYCYRIVSKGYRYIDGFKYENENASHISCVTPVDNVPPCAPEISGKSICDEKRNQIEWSYSISCSDNMEDDMEKFRIYFNPNPQSFPWRLIDSLYRDDVNNEYFDKFIFSHQNVLIGCYRVTAVDSVGNESPFSNIVCLDECYGVSGGIYEIPNVFTPGNDGFNDELIAFNPLEIVTKVNIHIFNRWGYLVFKTEDPYIRWDGRDMNSKQFVPTGVYYYIGDAYEQRLEGVRTIPVAGFVHVFLEGGKSGTN